MGANKSKAKNITELENDIQHSNDLLKTIKDKEGNIIQLKLESKSGGIDLLKDVQLWKLFIKIQVLFINIDKQQQQQQQQHKQNKNSNSSSNSKVEEYTTPLSVLKYNQYYSFRNQVVEFLESNNNSSGSSSSSNSGDVKTKGGGGGTINPDIDYDEDEYDHECPVCLENEATCVAPCMHRFCNQCINQWRAKQKSCPICITPTSNEDLDFELIDAPNEEELLNFFKKMLLKK